MKMSDSTNSIGVLRAAYTLHDFGVMLRAERKVLGLTQAELAKRAGVQRQTVMSMEAGQNGSTKALVGLMCALGKGVLIGDIPPTYDNLATLFPPDEN